jgi:tetratricopeptide (TPR) repeat protein
MVHLHEELAFELRRTRRFEEAIRYYDRAIALAPQNLEAHLGKLYCVLSQTGDITAARHQLERLAESHGHTGLAFEEWKLATWDRDYRYALGLLPSLSGIEELWGPPVDSLSYYLFKAWTYALMDEKDLAGSYADSARVVVERYDFSDPRGLSLLRVSLGVAYALLRQDAKAIQQGEMAAKLLPLSADAIEGANILDNLVTIYILVGEHESALELLERLLSVPSALNATNLMFDPQYDPIRDHPRFPELLELAQRVL